MEWYLKVMRDNYANFNGRARRKEYWMFTLFFMLFAFAFAFVSFIGVLSALGETAEMIGVILIVVWYLSHLVPSFAVTVRRLHDTGKSGWFLLLSFIPFGNLVIFIFTVMDGDRGDNEYGPDPKAIASKEAPAEEAAMWLEDSEEESNSNKLGL